MLLKIADMFLISNVMLRNMLCHVSQYQDYVSKNRTADLKIVTNHTLAISLWGLPHSQNVSTCHEASIDNP